MKFRNPETGEVWDAENAVTVFCDGKTCNVCPFFPVSQSDNCRKWAGKHSHEAAALMGYEVVEDEPSENSGKLEESNAVEGMCCDCAHGGPCCSWDENEDCQYRKEDGTCWVPYTKEEANVDKPRICEVLGIEVGEKFRLKHIYNGFLSIKENGAVEFDGDPSVKDISNLILWAVYHPEDIVRVDDDKPRFTQQEVERAKAIKVLYPEIRYMQADDRYLRGLNKGKESVFLDCVLSWFPSLRPNETVTIDEIIGGVE